MFLLDIDPATAATRMHDPSRGNDFGTVGDSLTISINAIPQFRYDWLTAGAISINAAAPVDEVGRELLAEAAMAVLRFRR